MKIGTPTTRKKVRLKRKVPKKTRNAAALARSVFNAGRPLTTSLIKEVMSTMRAAREAGFAGNTREWYWYCWEMGQKRGEQ